MLSVSPTDIDGVLLLQSTPQFDSRGHFFRWHCNDTLTSSGIAPAWVQGNQSLTFEAGTIRGLHYQGGIHAEQKLVRCIKGQIHCVVADVNQKSATYGKWMAVALSENEYSALFIPRTCAFGFQSLSPNATIVYLVDQVYSPEHETGVRWDDPTLAITWPLPVSQISARDLNLPNL